MLGTWVRIVARDADPRRAERAIERAFAAIREVDAQMSAHRADSDLARVNRAAGGAAVRVPAALVEVTAAACVNAERSLGIYDPTVLPLMRLYGFSGGHAGSRPSTRAIDEALELVGHRGVTVDRAASTIALARRGAGLDLGSIGKGWAVDRAAEAMRAEGVRSGLVDAGGNVYGFGVPEEGAAGWNVGILHPVTGAAAGTFALRDAAVATSGNQERFVTLDGLRFGHLFDARRGVPVDGHLSVSVMARTAVDADRMSTTAFLLGPSRFGVWQEALEVRFIG
jgi:thiamine biosynthesis lipoprotein